MNGKRRAFLGGILQMLSTHWLFILTFVIRNSSMSLAPLSQNGSPPRFVRWDGS